MNKEQNTLGTVLIVHELFKTRDMKKKLFMMMCCLLMIISAGCSSDDDGSDNSIISVNFMLQDENGVEKYTFYEGENIVFRLDIINNGDFDISYGLKDADVIFGKDLFCVYSNNGSIVGLPWTGMYCEYTGQKAFIIPANTVMHIYCPWYLCKDINTTHPLCKGDNIEKLPVGNYYTRFSIEYNKNTTSSNKQMTKKNIQVGFKVQ